MKMVSLINTGLLLKAFAYLTVSFGLSSICSSCDADGSHKNPNVFENGGNNVVKATFTSNADSVFLSWSVTGQVSFDGIEVHDAAGWNKLSLDKSSSGCVLTHIPYNKPVKISVNLTSGDKTVSENELFVSIDGIDHYIAHLIVPDSGSVTAGDGMYSIPLPDGRSIFLFGDSYTGNVYDGKRSTGDHMYRNSYSIYDNGKSFSLTDANGENTSAAVPPGVKNEGSEWYWPGHGFTAGNSLYIFQELMYQGSSGMWGFMYRNTHLLEYSLPDIKLLKDKEVPVHTNDVTHYGAAALNDGGYLYIYAQVDIENDADPVTEVLAARTTESGLWNEWEFYTGSGWSESSESAAALEGLSSVPVSSQFNVFKLRGKYVLLTQNKTFNSGSIYTFMSDNPYGPWRNKKLVYQIPSGAEQSNWFTYNAMAHPQFEKDDMILVSYNVNTDTFSEQFSNVESYRPRFFWVNIDDILNSK